MRQRGKVDPNAGGCWFCHNDDGVMYFEKEWDTNVHEQCLREALKDPNDFEASLMKYIIDIIDKNKIPKDAIEFIDRIEQSIAKIYPTFTSFEVVVTSDELPVGIDFKVISDDFEGMSHPKRMEFIAKVVEYTFSLHLNFRPMGVALTPSECDGGNVL